ncbi:hypothetical protein MGG_15712, partial [Pyricularia oryzae 70-15]
KSVLLESVVINSPSFSVHGHEGESHRRLCTLITRLMRNHVWSTKLFAVEWDLQFAPGPPPPTLRSCLDVFWLAVLHVYFVMCRSAMQAIMAVPICRE